MHNVLPLLRKSRFPAIKRRSVNTLQVNLGYLCNQSCVHCHVNAGPNRTEMMSAQTVDEVLDFARSTKVSLLDLTGGAPELNQEFRRLVTEARAAGIRVMDRCNLTVMFEPGQETLADFLAEQDVEITASLPCYSQDNVDAQRGKGVFDKSIAGLQKLNSLGYGDDRVLNLVYNPQGPVLPPSQIELEEDYRRFLGDEFGIRFSSLFTIANMPIQRFGSTLVSKGRFDEYMDVLQQAHRDDNLDAVMCRDLISVDHEGYVYDCDFNQMLGLPVNNGDKIKTHITELVAHSLDGTDIVVRDHCFGCTAGQGSSCGGALDEPALEAGSQPATTLAG
ncbi:MAG: arsenosugar biosynthesis radical SAM (seleno)protein ArsS [Burkholderiaceae bacterium]